MVGTIFGIVALGDKTTAEGDLTTANLDKLDVDAAIADVGFAAAIGFGAAGVVLLVNSGPSAAPPQTGLVRPRSRTYVAPYIGPTGGGATARLTF